MTVARTRQPIRRENTRQFRQDRGNHHDGLEEEPQAPGLLVLRLGKIMAHVPIPFRRELSKTLSGRMIDKHVRHVPDPVSHGRGALPPVPIFGDRHTGKGSDRLEHGRPHRQIAGHGEAHIADVPFHLISEDALVGLDKGQMRGVRDPYPHVAAQDLCAGIGKLGLYRGKPARSGKAVGVDEGQHIARAGAGTETPRGARTGRQFLQKPYIGIGGTDRLGQGRRAVVDHDDLVRPAHPRDRAIQGSDPVFRAG